MGWSTYGFLHWPKVARTDLANMGAEAMYYMLGLATKTPYNSNVDGQAYTAFSNTDATILTIVNTPFGRYKPNYNSIVWSNLKIAWGFVDTDTNYNSNVSDPKIELFLFGVGGVQNPNGGVVINPDNAFYNISKARNYTGSYNWTYTNAFDLQEYLNRYRTMDDNGNRLYFNSSQGSVGTAGNNNVGYYSNGNQSNFNIGYKVNNTLSYDVCMWTHIVSGLGTNDYTLSAENASNLQMQLLTELSNFGQAKVGYFMPRRSGVMYPEKWTEEGKCFNLNLGRCSFKCDYAK
jgi:hypothetical protein